MRLYSIGVFLVAALTACGGGGSEGSRALPISPPPPGGAAVQATISVPATQTGVPIPLPTLPGITGTITLPANDAPRGTSLTIATSATLPPFVNGAPEPNSVIFLTITLSSTANVTFQGQPKFVVTLSQPPANRGAYFAWMYDSVNAWTNFATPAVSGNTLTFGGNDAQLSLRANVPTAVVPLTASANAACPTATPRPTSPPTTTPSEPPPTATPTPRPTPTPTPVPTPVTNPLYVARDTDILVFPATASGNVAPGLTISNCSDCNADGEFFATIAEAGGLALDLQHHLFVANKGLAFASSIAEFAPGASGPATPLRYLFSNVTSLVQPIDVAIDSQGEILVMDQDFGPRLGHIDIYAPNANGNDAPLRVIVGDNTGLGSTVGHIGHAIAVDRARSIMYVTNADLNTVTAYRTSDNGNVAPILTISGNTTGLNVPTGIAVDATGNVYVGSQGSNQIEVFAPLSDGDVSPLRAISGTATELSDPGFIAVDSTGELYVSNIGNGNITVYASGAAGNAAPIRVLGGPSTGLSNRNEGIAVDR